MGILTRGHETFDEIIDVVKAKVPNRCENCVFWGARASWMTPPGWKRCKIDQEDTSPMYSCGNFKMKMNGG